MYDLVSPVLFREKVFRHRLLKLKMQILFRHQEGPPTFHHQTCQALLSTEPDLQQIFRHVLPKMLVAERTLAERTQSLAALSRKMTQPRADSSLEPLQEDDRQLLTESMVKWTNLDPPQHRRGRRDPQSSASSWRGTFEEGLTPNALSQIGYRGAVSMPSHPSLPPSLSLPPAPGGVLPFRTGV